MARHIIQRARSVLFNPGQAVFRLDGKVRRTAFALAAGGCGAEGHIVPGYGPVNVHAIFNVGHLRGGIAVPDGAKQ